jgi:hypothetical protein
LKIQHDGTCFIVLLPWVESGLTQIGIGRWLRQRPKPANDFAALKTGREGPDQIFVLGHSEHHLTLTFMHFSLF